MVGDEYPGFILSRLKEAKMLSTLDIQIDFWQVSLTYMIEST